VVASTDCEYAADYATIDDRGPAIEETTSIGRGEQAIWHTHATTERWAMESANIGCSPRVRQVFVLQASQSQMQTQSLQEVLLVVVR
jgi:hypothetical protein